MQVTSRDSEQKKQLLSMYGHGGGSGGFFLTVRPSTSQPPSTNCPSFSGPTLSLSSHHHLGELPLLSQLLLLGDGATASQISQSILVSVLHCEIMRVASQQAFLVTLDSKSGEVEEGLL